ncbi:MAG: DUF1398 domain-containing protein [Saprospiraceae bacterium]|nr:DUF1398 domain-containing protein [Saprospiraceae bacterium]MCF8252769.1 DUF1398 domain-containing protein [Saprospiraceae bacterium]MCF8283141.1 DUF1398 domain-containing protein [Bacteroidales bacterium]MCF8314321.1 DUF1398 domain-containing protein [Saprospiraceae bacterium]MCF8443196.1 DUF1398 domain-containing protein [Saprospiraceae bacterium]
MFTIEAIKAAHAQVKTGADFPAYIQAIKALGVTHYETFVTDSHTIYYGEEAHMQSAEPKYEALGISDEVNLGEFKAALLTHQRGNSDYMQFCRDCADNGVDKWAVSLSAMTCTYFDKKGNSLLVEEIPQ